MLHRSRFSRGTTALRGALALATLHPGCGAPSQCEPSWTVEVGDGMPVAAAAGDVNGDGYDDVLVGRPYDGEHPVERERPGRALLYRGGPCGLSRDPSWAVEGEQAGARFGGSVATAGDVNRDGYADVVVGADEFQPRGRAYLFLGSPEGLSTEPEPTLTAEEPHYGFGSSAASAGDVNGDGFSDVAVGAYRDTGDRPPDALLYPGSADGLADEPAWLAGEEAVAVLPVQLAVVAPVGDVNGDGFSDLMLVGWYASGAGGEGRLLIYLGSSGGLSRTPAWTASQADGGLWISSPVAAAADVDGDGFDDVVVAGASESSRGGFAYRGSSEGLPSEPSLAYELDGQGPTDLAAGDINGDGIGDVIVGRPWHENREDQEGTVHLYLGSAEGLAWEPVWSTEGDENQAHLGEAVVSAGDVDGDGLGDLLVAARKGGLGGTYTFHLYLGSAIVP